MRSDGKKGKVATLKVGRVIKGSIVRLRRVCGKSGCHCYQGKKHESMYLSRSVKGTTQMTYVAHRYEEMVEKGVKEYKSAVAWLDRLSQRHMAAIQRGKVK